MIDSGFTLIELMVTVAVLAIIVSIAAPNISTQLANQRVKSTTATLVNALKEARAESLIRRQEVEVSIDDDDYEIEIEIEIEVDDDNSTIIANYSYSAKSIIDGDDDITFKPNKTADEETLTICDTNTAASPRQITVSKLGQVSTASGGTC
jgi:type IV fimbrial biogenesis protein FimT